MQKVWGTGTFEGWWCSASIECEHDTRCKGCLNLQLRTRVEGEQAVKRGIR